MNMSWQITATHVYIFIWVGVILPRHVHGSTFYVDPGTTLLPQNIDLTLSLPLHLTLPIIYPKNQSEGNDSWITRVQKHLTLGVNLKQTFLVNVSLNSDWLIGMLFQDQQGHWSRNMLYLVKPHSLFGKSLFLCILHGSIWYNFKRGTWGIDNRIDFYPDPFKCCYSFTQTLVHVLKWNTYPHHLW